MAGADANYMTLGDLEAAAALCSVLNAWESLCLTVEARIIDSNGEHIGTVTYDAAGAGEYVFALDGKNG